MSELNDNGDFTIIGSGENVAGGLEDPPPFPDDFGGNSESGEGGENAGTASTIEFPEAISQSIWYEKIYDSDENSQTAKHLV